MMGGKILTKNENGVQWLILNQPEKRNAISLEMMVDGLALLQEISSQETVRVLVVTGAGDTAFCAGGDISEFDKERENSDKTLKYEAVAKQFFDALNNIDKPTIAMIHGYCLGGGITLAASCDIRICSDEAQFSIPAARLGIGYGVWLMQKIIDIIGPSFTKEMLYTANLYSAYEALQMGFVNKCVAAPDLENYVSEYACNIASNAPLSIKAAKVVAAELQKPPGSRNLSRCTAVIEECANSQDYANARIAFMEKRKAQFTGK
jgi:enoyl-CoA hydratase